jgi:exonuclease III
MYDPNLPAEVVCNFDKDICYRYLVPHHELRTLLKEGYNVYFIDGMREFTTDVHGYDLYDYQTLYLAIETGLPHP